MLKIFIVLFGKRVINYNAIPRIGNETINPMYTIIIPMFMERGRDIVGIRNHLFQMEYCNFEILYLCEDIDVTLVRFINSLNLKSFERIVNIPRIAPFTKPKACNYGLEFAKGEYIVVYDIEDRPHLKQLQIAHQTFTQNPSYSCIQFPLEFVSDGTILGMWQRIDYLLWYKRLLPVLVHFKLPIPLGGTSNHFKVANLRRIKGWNAYNVTEDAELGLRMYSLGMGVMYIPKYQTKETVVKNIVNLMKQRVRWSKGHIITAVDFLVRNIKAPISSNFAVFFVLISNPFCYISHTILTFANGFYYETHLIVLMTLGIVLFFIYPFFIMASFSELRKLKNIPPVLLLPFYYIFYAIPIIISLIECVFKPTVWYKTKR